MANSLHNPAVEAIGDFIPVSPDVLALVEGHPRGLGYEIAEAGVADEVIEGMLAGGVTVGDIVHAVERSGYLDQRGSSVGLVGRLAHVAAFSETIEADVRIVQSRGLVESHSDAFHYTAQPAWVRQALGNLAPPAVPNLRDNR